MRYTGPKCRLCRREGTKLFLKGTRCTTQKCGITRHNAVPGKYGKNKIGKKTEYHNQLRSKQKSKRIYGLSEKQFKSYFTKATRMEGNSSENFIRLLEMRLDNAVFRAGFATNRNSARQIVSHGAFREDRHRVNIPSRQVKIGDRFTLSSRASKSPAFADFAKKKDGTPKWIKADYSKLTFEIVSTPTLEESEQIDAQTIVEFYSR